MADCHSLVVPVLLHSMRAAKPEMGDTMPNPQRIPRTPILAGVAAEARTQQLGLPGTALLVEALRDGASAARTTTPMHPRAYRGQRMWGEAVASLGFSLTPHGWEHQTFLGVDLIVEPRLGTALLVTAGDAATGREDYVPQVRYERREVIQGLVNGSLDTLWGPTPRPEWEVWFLLHNLALTSLSAELSHPISVNNSGRVMGWSERIMMPDTAFGGPNPSTRRDEHQPAEVRVEVQRRVG